MLFRSATTHPPLPGVHEIIFDMKAACVALLITFFLAVAEPELAPHKCRITVTDSEGAVIGSAHIFVHRDPLATAAIPDRIMDADKDGKLELALAEGYYDVCVMSPAFTPMLPFEKPSPFQAQSDWWS